MENLYKLSAFPKTDSGGNKAGVYINADNLNVQEMQAIAKKVNFSETAFVSKSDNADFKVRFFTPTNEVDLCGHATIATFNLLRDLNIISVGHYTQETKAGILELIVNEKNVFMEQPKPKYFGYVSEKEIANTFANLEFDKNLKPQIVSTGMREIFLPVKDIHTLNNLVPNLQNIIEISKKYDVIGIHAFCIANDADAYGRNFGPIVGIDEESATGTSNGALGCYLFKHWKQKPMYILRQGYSMNLPSEIITKLEIANEEILKVWVGGSAIIIKE